MRRELEHYLTKIPMYTLVGGALGALITIALLLSIVGALSFSPFALIVSSLVICAVSVGSSYLFGKLYTVHSHLRSALITALILTLIFTPSLDVIVLLKLALIALIAQASKFVITYKQRHIFNPAVVGAVLGGLLQLQYASWWVGTPVLVIPLAIAVFLVLYKTRQLEMGVLFLAISLLILSATGVGIWTALASWPILFVAGIMLSEPATLPPRRWQKLVVAVAVAIIISLPFHVGWFYSSPEIALLIGNILAFGLAFQQRKGLRLMLSKHHSLTPTVDEFVFASPTPITFEAGQYVELTLPHSAQDMRGIRRSFSVTSVPGENELKLGIKFQESGSSFKRALRELPVGTVMQATGITGDFVLPSVATQKLLFVAGGIGITPFISHIESSDASGRDIVLLYFMRDPSEAAYKDILDASNATVYYFVSDGAGGDFKAASYPSDELIDTYVDDAQERVAYISGSPAMVTAARTLLKDKVHRIKTDYFSGY